MASSLCLGFEGFALFPFLLLIKTMCQKPYRSQRLRAFQDTAFAGGKKFLRITAATLLSFFFFPFFLSFFPLPSLDSWLLICSPLVQLGVLNLTGSDTGSPKWGRGGLPPRGSLQVWILLFVQETPRMTPHFVVTLWDLCRFPETFSSLASPVLTQMLAVYFPMERRKKSSMLV